MKVLLLFLGMFPVLSFAQGTTPLVFQPAFAADQSVITTNSLDYESAQFKNLASLKAAEAGLKTSQLDRDNKKTEYERMQKLGESGQASPKQIEESQIDYLQSESALIATQGLVAKAQVSTEIQKLRVLQEGNPDKDYRIQISQYMRDASESDRLSKQAALHSQIPVEIILPNMSQAAKRSIKRAIFQGGNLINESSLCNKPSKLSPV